MNSPSLRPAPGRVVVLASDRLGEGDERLGAALMHSFLGVLVEKGPVPEAILCYNGGARLSAQGSESLAELRALQEAGAWIGTCGTCVDYFELHPGPAVGDVTTMAVIAERMMAAQSVIRP